MDTKLYESIKKALIDYITNDESPYQVLSDVLILNGITPCYKAQISDTIYYKLNKTELKSLYTELIRLYIELIRIGYYNDKVIYAIVSYSKDLYQKIIHQVDFIEIYGSCS
jgi:serine protease inhibitor